MGSRGSKVEDLVEHNLFNGVYNGKRVLVTGHTGFKGSWLVHWLCQMGATVCGYSTEAPSEPAHIDLLKLKCESHIGDIRDISKLQSVVNNFKPEIVFHLAAQALVRLSYAEPIETFDTNIIGSLQVYEACRKSQTVKSIVTITTDKVYQNNEWTWGYREIDRLGGKDPYSASKAAMEIVTQSYIHSYFNKNDFGKSHDMLVATARAGNVIGGGDWALDRLIPDIIKASNDNRSVEIRSPHSTRPWQHVLEPLSGYLLLGQKLLERNSESASEFNFGPNITEDLSVKEVVEFLKTKWSKITYVIKEPKIKLHEARLLKLDCTKAFTELNWTPVLTAKDALTLTIDWYKAYYSETSINTKSDLETYIKKAKELGLVWA